MLVAVVFITSCIQGQYWYIFIFAIFTVHVSAVRNPPVVLHSHLSSWSTLPLSVTSELPLTHLLASFSQQCRFFWYSWECSWEEVCCCFTLDTGSAQACSPRGYQDLPSWLPTTFACERQPVDSRWERIPRVYSNEHPKIYVPGSTRIKEK